MLVLITVCTFGTIALLILGVTMRSEREIAKERLQSFTSVVSTTSSGMDFDVKLDLAFGERVAVPVLRWLARIGMRFVPSHAVRAIDEKLETAGRPWNLGSTEFIGLKVLSIAVLTPVAFVAPRFIDVSPFIEIVLAVLIIFMGIILPDYLLQREINIRQTKIRKALADTLDLLTVSVQAGLGLDGAMQKVAEKLKGPLSDELERALQEMQIGKLRADALKDVAKRAKVRELSTFVTAVCQADQLGVSIANVLRVQSETLRAQRSQRAREAGAKLPVKMLFPLVFFIFPAILIVIAGPAVIQIGRALGIIK